MAVIFYGQLRTFNLTLCSIEKHLLAPIIAEGFLVHLFVVAEQDQNAFNIRLLNFSVAHNTTLKVVPRGKVDPGCAKAFHQRFNHKQIKWLAKKAPGGYVREYLARMQYRDIADRMREQHEQRTGQRFKWMLISRMDVFYVRDIVPLGSLDRNKVVYVPDFLHYDGINDRFALAPPLTGSQYARLYSTLCDNNGKLAHSIPKEGSSETIFKWHLNRLRIRIRKLPPEWRFGRVRLGAKEPKRQDFQPYDKEGWYEGLHAHVSLCRRRTAWLARASASMVPSLRGALVLCGVETQPGPIPEECLANERARQQIGA